MKTKTLILSKISLSVLFTAIVVVIYALSFGTAFAQVVPVVDTTIKNASSTVVTLVPMGTVVYANTTVSSSTGPVALGTVDFNLYQNTTCSGTASIQSGVLLASGSADSSTTTVPNTGLSYKVHYNGQVGVYSPADGSCVAVSPTSSSVIVNSTLSSTTVIMGTSVSQSATLSGATANATGTVSYGVYTNNACTLGKIDAGIKNVTNGAVVSSNSVQFNTVGTLYWQAQYSGDQNNSGANGPCQSLSVLASTTPSTPPVPPIGTGNGSLSGISYNDLNKNLVKDSGEAGISGYTIKLYGGVFWWNWGKMNPIRTTTTDANGVYTLSNLPDGLYKIEEIKLSGWSQISSDYRWVLIINGKNLTGLDFANVVVNATTTNNQDRDDDDDDDNHKNRGQEKKKENMKKKELRKEAQKQKKINKWLEKIERLRSR